MLILLRHRLAARILRLAPACLAFTLLTAFSASAVAERLPSPETASARAVAWLQAQRLKDGFVRSYPQKPKACFVYDQALAAIVFSATSYPENARQVLDALQRRQASDGSWASAYVCEDSEVAAAPRYVGVVCWVLLAIAHYQQHTGDRSRYEPMARRALAWVKQFQQSDGGINGGIDADGNDIPWASTEHNEDALAAFRYFGETKAAARIAHFLTRVVYDRHVHRWFQGRNDFSDPLDVLPLGIMSEPDGVVKPRDAIRYAEHHHRNTQLAVVDGVQQHISGFDYDGDKNDIWLEGTAQMAVAYRMVGDTHKARRQISALIRLQAPNGSLPYSLNGTVGGGFHMASTSAIASTAWLVFAIEGINPLRP